MPSPQYQEATLPIAPSHFFENEAWLLFQLNDAPVRTDADGDFNAVAIMEASTGSILGMELVPLTMIDLPEFSSRKLLASSETKAGARPQKLFLACGDEADELVKVATAMKIEVESVPADDLAAIT